MIQSAELRQKIILKKDNFFLIIYLFGTCVRGQTPRLGTTALEAGVNETDRTGVPVQEWTVQ